MANPPESWGNKRARTAPSGGTPAALPAAAAPSGGTTCGGGARDWAGLGGDGPTGLIGELVLASSLHDYVRFRAVCRSWRQCSPDPRAAGGLDGRFLPRHWIMLDKAAGAASRRHRFLNVSTGECIHTDLPELADHTLLALTPEGRLLLLHEPTLAVRLLNPLTRQLTDLPPVTELLTEVEQRAWRSGERPLKDMLQVTSAGLADDASIVAVLFRWPTALAVARPGDDRWTVVDDGFMDSTLACAGRFYCVIRGSVMVLDTRRRQHPRLRLVATEQRDKSFRYSRASHSLHLVDNGGGELLLVRRTPGQDSGTPGAKKYRRKCKVFKVDLRAGKLAPAKGLRGRAVFMGLARTVSVSAGAFPSVAADTVYLGYDCAEKTGVDQIDGYNVSHGSSKPIYNDSCHEMVEVQPWSAVDCLSYCIKGNGEHLVA
ncbi:unnamed protein product [Urochloa decumbens]|uniref:KIB1-4 beta-propeller domain-containing protein n=1 Tax=Urochloa decumbens TaxID=240449 RepID=A0ABC9FYA7_9POAL